MFFRCVSRGDEQGAEWILDTMLKWESNQDLRLGRYDYYLRHEKLLNIGYFTKEWDDIKNALDLETVGVRAEGAPIAILTACLKNYWIDMCCVSLYILAVWGKDCVCKESMPVTLLTSLLEGHAPKPGGEGISGLKPLSSAGEFLTALLRQYHANGGHSSGYRLRLNKVVEDVEGFDRPWMVPGRIYSGWGIDDLDSVKDGQILLLCILVTTEWNPLHSIDDILQKWVAENDEALRGLQGDLKKWIERLDDVEFSEYKKLFLCIKKFAEDSTAFETTVASVKSGVQVIINHIDDIRTQKLEEIQVSEKRLIDVALWASKLGFSSVTGDVPVNLFCNINYSAGRFVDRSLIIKDMNKGEFTEPGMAQRSVNEDSWFAQTIRDRVAATVMSDVLAQIKTISVDASTPELYWQEAKQWASEIRKQSCQPLLLLENSTIPSWVWDWRMKGYDEKVKRPADLNLRRAKAFEGVDGYLGNLNDIAVFNTPLPHGASYILAKEALEELCFTTFGDQQYVEVTVKEKPDKKGLIDLHLTWAYLLKLHEYPAVRMEYKDHKEDE